MIIKKNADEFNRDKMQIICKELRNFMDGIEDDATPSYNDFLLYSGKTEAELPKNIVFIAASECGYLVDLK